MSEWEHKIIRTDDGFEVFKIGFGTCTFIETFKTKQAAFKWIALDARLQRHIDKHGIPCMLEAENG